MEKLEENNSLLLSYLVLRRLIGFLGLAFPMSMLVYAFVISDCGLIERSISTYYHTGMHDIFVGVLCATGVFMIAYKGYDWRDRLGSTLAGIFAIGVAMFPTDVLAICGNSYQPSPFVGTLHWVSAAGLFATFSVMSIWLFTLSNAPKLTREKKIRNRFYRGCGYIMLADLAVLLLHEGVGIISEDLKPIFWCETIALLAFGTSWLVKGEMIFKDATAPTPEPATEAAMAI